MNVWISPLSMSARCTPKTETRMWGAGVVLTQPQRETHEPNVKLHFEV